MGRTRHGLQAATDLLERAVAAGLPDHHSAAHLRIPERVQELFGRVADRPDGAACADQTDRRILRQPVRGLHPRDPHLLHAEHEPDAADACDREESRRTGTHLTGGQIMDFTGIVPAIPGLWNGMVMTLKLMAMGVVGGLVLGTLLALMRLSSNKLLANVAGAYVNYFRSIPLLLVITWFYLAVPFVLRWITGEDTPIGAFASCVVAFMMFEAAYFCEIVRAGVQSISKGQMGAAQALGMNYSQMMRLIILPQAFRKMTPLLLQQSIILFQDTSLVYTVGLVDFLNASRSSGDIIGRANEFLIIAGLVYFTISFAASLLVKRLQKRFAV
ncbi:Aspartate/glutamate ABC-type transport system [Pseudomonas syringae pv. papulans]|nr:Aspartate/glutamate ABC-type transport system [Pseudomonas syringae pv. papulans]